MTKTDLTLQSYADETLDHVGLPQLKQQLKTLREAFAANGWALKIDVNEDVMELPDGIFAKSIVGKPVEYYEPTTGKFARDVSGPLGDNGVCPAACEETIVRDEDRFPAVFIVGTRAVNAMTEDAVDEIEEKLASQKAYDALVEFALSSIFGKRNEADDGVAALLKMLSSAGDEDGDAGSAVVTTRSPAPRRHS